MGSAGAARAQKATANVNASVIVAAPPVTFFSTRSMEFGRVAPGMTVTVPARPPFPSPDTWSAGFRFFNLRKQVDYAIWFTLPATIDRGAAQIPVQWNDVSFGWMCIWRSNPATCDVLSDDFSPGAHASAAAAYLLDMPNGTPGNNFVGEFYVGGRLVVPNTPLPPGTYTAPLTITVAPIN